MCDCRFKVHFGHQFSINLWKSIMNIQTQSKNWPYQTLTSGNVIDFLDNNWCSVIVCICLAVSLTSVMRRVRHSHKCFCVLITYTPPSLKYYCYHSETEINHGNIKAIQRLYTCNFYSFDEAWKSQSHCFGNTMQAIAYILLKRQNFVMTDICALTAEWNNAWQERFGIHIFFPCSI